jgi:hypothetical protein
MRSWPKNISSPTKLVGAPKTPRATASSVVALEGRLDLGVGGQRLDRLRREAGVLQGLWQCAGWLRSERVDPHRLEHGRQQVLQALRLAQLTPVTARIRNSVMIGKCGLLT